MIKSKNYPLKTIGESCVATRVGPFGSALHKTEMVPEGPVFVLGTDNAVDNEFKVYEERYISSEKYSELERYTVVPGDIIITMMGTIGRSAVIPEYFKKSIISSHLSCLSVDTKVVLPEYLQKCMVLDHDVSKHLDSNKKGSIMSGLNLKIIKAIPFSCPPINVQKQFMTFVEQVDKSKVIFQKSFKSRFIEMFQPFFNLKNCVSLESLCNTFIDGDWIESKDQDTSGIRLIQTGNVGVSTYLDKADKARFINEKTFERLNCTEVLPGDILISRLPDPIARSCIVPDGLGKSITGVDCTIVRFKDKINPVFFNQYTLIDHYLSQISAFEAGSTRKRISRKNLGKIKVPLPPIDLQNQFASFIEQVDKSKFHHHQYSSCRKIAEVYSNL